MNQPLPPQPAAPGGPPAAAAPPQGGPPQGGAPQGGGAAVQLPPGIARHIDPNNAIQMLLMQRVDQLAPQDGMVIGALPPEAIAALKKIVPEIAFMFDLIVKRAAVASGRAQPMGRPGAAPGAPMPGGAPGAPGAPPAQPPGPAQPPQSRLNRF